MSRNAQIVDAYERICEVSGIDILCSGRYLFSGLNYVNFLANDIAAKLEIQKNDRLLDVGCNVGIYHRLLKDRVSNILGLDAGDKIVKKAKEKNRYSNVDYMKFNALEGNWDKIPRGFNKVIVYSVIHFFDDLEDVKKLLMGLLKVLDDNFIILLGDVRDREMYMDFQDEQKTSRFLLRDLLFAINKKFNSFYLGKTKRSPRAPTLFSREEIFTLCDILGLKVELVKQGRRHPFYNTSVDYVLRRG